VVDETMTLPGIELMGENVRKKLASCGEGVKLHPLSKVCLPEKVELDDFCRLGDFSFIWGGNGVKIGKHTDFQVHSVIWGGGECVIGDYVSIGLGSILLTAVYSHKEGLRMVDGLPEGHALGLYGKLVIEDDVYVGAHCTVLPDITVGEGAILGAGSLVNKDVEPWSIVVGSPARKIGERPKVSVGR
jgi:galactoside O-acetyltransferase